MNHIRYLWLGQIENIWFILMVLASVGAGSVLISKIFPKTLYYCKAIFIGLLVSMFGLIIGECMDIYKAKYAEVITKQAVYFEQDDPLLPVPRSLDYTIYRFADKETGEEIDLLLHDMRRADYSDNTDFKVLSVYEITYVDDPYWELISATERS